MDEGIFYYTMEYLDDHHLMDIVQRSGEMAYERVIYLMTQVCDSLYEAHGLGCKRQLSWGFSQKWRIELLLFPVVWD